MWRRTGEIIRKEFLQTFREPRMRIVLFVPPLMQLLIFGYAVNLDLENTRIGWMDLDRTPQSRDLRAAFEGSRYFAVAALAADARETERLLDRGRVQAVVRVLPGFARDLERGRRPAVQILVEGTNSNTASLVSSYASQVVNQHGLRLMGRPRAALEAETRVWFNPELRSRNYFVPGVVVNIIMIVTLMLTAMAIVREKEIGTMEQLMVTPIRPIELMIGKTVPFALIGLVDVALITTAALVVFRIPFRGSALLLFACAGLFLMTTLGTGLLLSTISETQQQAVLSSFLFTTPAFLLSGFAFPIRNMPPAIQYLTYLNPLRYFMEIVRGIFLKGTGIEILWPQMAALAVFGVGVLAWSALRFRKSLD